MDFIRWFLDFLLHLDQHLGQIIADYGTWTYLLLFIIVFCETGFVATPFLPGDSLLFTAGAFAGRGDLDVTSLFGLLAIAAIAGDTVNYWIGAYIGPRAFTGNYRFLKREYLERTHRFYEKHGGKTIILARFIPIVRTFAPFVAGIGVMSYGRFFLYNLVGGLAWVALMTFAGYFFAHNEFVKEHFGLVVVAIIVISVLPLAWEIFRARFESQQSREGFGIRD